jgi:hypothetical protein
MKTSMTDSTQRPMKKIDDKHIFVAPGQDDRLRINYCLGRTTPVGSGWPAVGAVKTGGKCV